MNPRGRMHLIALPAILLLSACASQQAQQPSVSTPSEAAAPADIPPAPASVISGDADDQIAFKVWSAEVFGTDGDLEKSAAEYVEAALLSSDPAIARRATEVAISARMWQAAAMAADRWTVLDPDNVQARRTAARTSLVGGDYALAEVQLEELLGLQREETWGGWEDLGGLLMVGPDAERAVTMVTRLIEQGQAGDNAYALLVQSQVVARTGRFDEAMALADQAVTLAPQEIALRMWAGRVALNAEDSAAALNYFESAWRLDPTQRTLALSYAELLRQNGNLDEANDVLSVLPDTPTNRFTRIGFAVESGKRALALSLFEDFGRMPYGDPVEQALQAARSAEALGLTDDAISWYEKLEGTDQALPATLRRASLLASSGRMEEARQVLLFARNSGGQTVKLETLLVEANLLLEADRGQEAFDTLTGALNEFPDNTRLLYMRSLIAVGLDQIDTAETDLRAVLALEPSNAAALNALGYTLADRTSRLEEAEGLIQRAYALEPEDAAIIDSMGWIAYRMGRFEEARRYLELAFLRDRNAEIAAHLGEVIWVLGDTSRARQVWNEGMRIEPGNQTLLDTMQRFGVRP